MLLNMRIAWIQKEARRNFCLVNTYERCTRFAYKVTIEQELFYRFCVNSTSKRLLFYDLPRKTLFINFVRIALQKG